MKPSHLVNLVAQIIAILGCIILAMSGGCSTTRSGDATGGVAIELYVRSDRDSFARYRLETDGTLAYAGGVNAHASIYTWEGPLTDEELIDLRAILEEHDDFRRRPQAPDRPMDTREYTITVDTSDGHRHKYTVTGRTQDLEPLHQLLRSAAERRHAEALNRLPRATEQME